MKDILSKEIKENIAQFDKDHILSNIILLGFGGEIRNIVVGFEFDETYTEQELNKNEKINKRTKKRNKKVKKI